MDNFYTFDETYLFHLMSFIGMKKLEYLYTLSNWDEVNNLRFFFGFSGEILKKLLHTPTFLNSLCDAYNIKIQTTFIDLIRKYKKKYLFTIKYDTEDRIIYYINYMTSYEAIKKAARMNDWDFLSYMLQTKNLKYSYIHIQYLALGFYDRPQLSYHYCKKYPGGSIIPPGYFLEKGLIKACKYGVPEEVFRQYLALPDFHIKDMENILTYIVGLEHQHLYSIVNYVPNKTYDYLSAVRADNLALAQQNTTLSREQMIAAAVQNGSIKILNYLNVTSDEITQHHNHGEKKKIIKYLYDKGISDEELLQISRKKYNYSFKSIRWFYKKYKLFIEWSMTGVDASIEFLYYTDLIFMLKICKQILNQIIDCEACGIDCPESVQILLKIKDDERVKELFNNEIIRALERMIN